MISKHMIKYPITSQRWKRVVQICL